jgi:hypothetical protein
MHGQTALLIVRRAISSTPKEFEIATAIILSGPECLDEQGFATVEV